MAGVPRFSTLSNLMGEIPNGIVSSCFFRKSRITLFADHSLFRSAIGHWARPASVTPIFAHMYPPAIAGLQRTESRTLQEESSMSPPALINVLTIFNFVFGDSCGARQRRHFRDGQRSFGSWRFQELK